MADGVDASRPEDEIISISDDCQSQQKDAVSQKSQRSMLNGLYNCFQPFLQLFTRGTDTEDTDDWEIKFDDIRELKWVGSGAQGVVFFGIHNGVEVAVKKVRHEKETDIKHLRNLKHPNIVSFRGICTQSPCYCLVMEYCSEGPLFDLLKSGRQLTPPTVLEWAKQIATGMNYLHSKKILHRDLKSPNVLIGSDDSLKISDFGTAKELGEKSTRMSFAGTVAWMAPEVIRNELCSEKVDVWSYGVVLWELLTQEIPYKGVDSSAIIWGVGSESIHLPVPSSCPHGFQLIMRQCWQSKPKNRPTFRQILMHLEIAASDFLSIPEKTFFKTQICWREEIKAQFVKMKADGTHMQKLDDELIRRREEEIRQVEDIRAMYEKKLTSTNRLYNELHTCMEQLERKQRDLDKRSAQLHVAEIYGKGMRRNSKGKQKRLLQGKRPSSDSFTHPIGCIPFFDPDSPLPPSRHRKESIGSMSSCEVVLFENKPSHCTTCEGEGCSCIGKTEAKKEPEPQPSSLFTSDLHLPPPGRAQPVLADVTSPDSGAAEPDDRVPTGDDVDDDEEEEDNESANEMAVQSLPAEFGMSQPIFMNIIKASTFHGLTTGDHHDSGFLTSASEEL
eukprot:m.307006 g.307006  ORF g.307006 m.307006 type:complete len:615 (+) comp41806_c0_seq1:3138-4982(+)